MINHKRNKKRRVAIAGASRYAGYELVKLLIKHPQVDITDLAVGEDITAPICDFFPALQGRCGLMCLPIDTQRLGNDSEILFLALPHKISMQPPTYR